MSEDTIPEPDRAEGAPHPRETVTLYGQHTAEAAFLQAHAQGRLHHAWLLTGPRGTGKATLAWAIARFLAADDGGGLFGAPDSLSMDPDHPVFRRALQLAEPSIHLCRRGWDDKAKRLKTVLTVDEVRRLKAAFALSNPDGGWRAAIVDAADEMNASAANALLKLLEEPPERTVLLLVCHQPGALLPTIRSRCRELRLAPLGPEDLTRALRDAGTDPDDPLPLHKLSGGSVGEALRLVAMDGLTLYRQLLALLANTERPALLQLTSTLGGAANAPRYDLTARLWLDMLGRLARAGASGDHGALIEDERALVRQLVPTIPRARALAELRATLAARFAHARAVNLDPEHVILDMVLETEKALRQTA